MAATFVASASLTSAASLPSGFNETTLASGLNLPTLMQIAPDGRLFVSERNGRLRVFQNNQLLGTPFLTVPVSTEGERGLLGIAFDPNFASNRYVYIFYTRNSPLENRVSRFQASATNPNVSTGSEQVLLRIPHRGNIYHNGGSIQFGNDGKLYIAVGDHQSGDGRGNNMWGKVLRINPDGSIPSDNPYLSSPIPDQVWAIGFRNPFGMDIQRGTGRIFVNDVGNSAQTGREEINELRRGANYNWNASEGPGSFYSYAARSQGGCAIVGGDFYNPPTNNFPSQYVGKYFYGDHCGGWIKYINSSGSPGSPVTFLTGLGNNSITDVEVGLDGSLYYSSRNGGVVRRVRFGNATPTPNPRVTPTPTPGEGQPPVPVINTPTEGTQYSGGQTINFSGSCTDPEDGTRPASALTWEILFHHNEHNHPFFGPQSGITGGSFTVLRDNESEHTVWYRIHLTCADSRGNRRTVTRDVRPRVVTLTLVSNPPGLRLQSDHVSGNAPVTTQSVVGVNRMLTAPSPQTVGGTRYVFVSWSDGGGASHQIVTPGSNTTYTATFRADSSYTEVTPGAGAVTASTHDGNLPGNTVDNNLGTRWSAAGDGQWLRLDLGRARTIGYVGVGVYNGNGRRNRFELQVSPNGSSWTTVFSGESSGTTTAEEVYDFTDVSARYVRYLGHRNNVNDFNSVTEVSVFAIP